MYSTGFSKFLKASFIVGALAGIVAVPGTASAALLGTYTPPVGSTGQADLNDLDHHLMYSWRIQDSALAGKTITSATLTFTKMYNWNDLDNRLFVDLLDTAYTKGTVVNGGAVQGWSEGSDCRSGTGVANCGVTYFTDDPNASNNAVTIRDDFKFMGDDNPAGGYSNPFQSQAGWLVASGTARTQMTAKEFLGGNDSYGSPDNADGAIDPTGWSHTSAGTGYYSYTYTFQAADLYALNVYLDSGSLNDFALAFDPDCHFYNDGITLTLNGVNGGSFTNQAVPEPATLMLFGTGLAYVGRRYRRKR